MPFPRGGTKALLIACLIGAPACSLVVSLDGLDDGGAPDSSVPDAGADVVDAKADATAIADSGTDAVAPPVDAHVSVLPKFRAFSEADNSSTGTTITVQRSPLIQEGDLMIAIVYEYTLSTTSTPPSGWTTGLGVNGTVGSYEVFSYYRFAGASEPLSYSFLIDTTGYGEADLISYSGVDPVTPFDDAQTMTYSSTPNFALPQLTTSELNDVIAIVAVADGQGSAMWTSPADFTSHKNTGYTYFGDIPQVNPGQFTGRTLVCSVAANGGVLATALRPQ